MILFLSHFRNAMDPIKLQQDLRNNQEDLQSYMCDLRNWTDQIKKKDKELASQSKLEKLAVSAKCKGSGDSKMSDTPKDQALAESKGHKNEMAERVTPSEEVLKLKEAGNECLKKKEYEEAIKHYTAAMELDSSYHILPANRGMAYLKLNSFEKAEQDCGQAVALDPGYIKGYLRRGTARLELGKLQLAKEDYENVLKLEPHNPQARMSLERIKEEETKQARLKATKRKGDLSASDDLDTKTSRSVSNQSSVNEKPAHMRSKVPLKKIPVVQVRNDDELNSFIDGSVISRAGESPAIQSSGAEQSPTVNGETKKTMLEEMTVTDEKQPSLETPKGNEVTQQTSETECKENQDQLVPESKTEKKQASALKTALPAETIRTPPMTLPAVPRSSYEFVRDWKLLRAHADLRGQYLRQIPPDEYAAIFKQALEESTLVEILRVAESLPVSEIGNHLMGLSRVQRVDVLVMFMGGGDRKLLQSLVARCEQEGLDMADVKKRVGV